ncbi:MAG TPA: TonB-dependent receptor plug domain-containing protein [Gemmatimonadales bacterium]|nr:TonB-dependent receptor plug domain-containing protein [Gemmatimonadales bacterium]
MRRRSLYGMVLVLLALGARDARAQARVITGKVTSAQSGQPVGGATVSVLGTVIVAVSNAQGEYSLAAPDGVVNILSRSIGYKRKQVQVAADQATADIALDQDIFNLEAVVVTGQATSVEQKNLANAVTSVTAAQLNGAPTSTIEGALQGKIPGALVQLNSGAPGGGAQINLRGVSTINGNPDPVIVVDGMIISNAAIANNLNAVTNAAGGGNASNQDNPVNRIADLNPADIEKVEVLKGPSAASIYGGAANSGVIVITTRRGQTGAPRFHVTQRLGEFGVLNVLKSRVFKDSVEADAVYGGSAQAYCTGSGGACPYFDNISPLWDNHPLSTETDASVSGGNDATRYFVSGLVKRDGGIAPNTGYDKQALRVNLDQQMGSRWSIGVQTQAIHSLSNRGISNNDNSGTSPYLVFPLTPSFVNLAPTGPKITDYPRNPFERSNPLQTYAFFKNAEDLWRIFANTQLKFDAITTAQHNLRFTAFGGLDNFSQRNDIYSPPELYFESNDGQPGTVVLGKTQNTNVNLLGSGVYTYTPSSGSLTATTSATVQYINTSLNFSNIVGRDILTGLQNVDKAANITNLTQNETPVRDVGVSLQEEVLAMNQRLLVTGGVRGDRSSRNGDVNKFFYYPKFAASYRLLGVGGPSNEIKLRGAYGQTGTQPNFGNKFSPNLTGTIDGQFGSFAGIAAGSADIKPERQTEIEAGADATLSNGRLIANLTVFNKTVTDLLLTTAPAPSSGVATRILNGGKLRDRGLEASLGYALAQRPDFNWIVRGNFTTTRSKVVELPVPTFQPPLGFGTSLGTFQIEVGKSATQIVGNDSTGAVVALGDANPDFQLSLGSDLTYKNLSFSFLWDYKKGGDVINLTELLFDLFQNSRDWSTVGDSSGVRPAHLGGQQRLNEFFKGNTYPYVQDASYIKLREANLAFRLPQTAVSHLFGDRVKGATISLSGRNLIRILPTHYRGIDPEVSNFGNQPIGRNIDVAPFPPSRSVFFSIDLDF